MAGLSFLFLLFSANLIVFSRRYLIQTVEAPEKIEKINTQIHERQLPVSKLQPLPLTNGVDGMDYFVNNCGSIECNCEEKNRRKRSIEMSFCCLCGSITTI
ncbi:uncharacterized protein LOC111698600 [Eurytemora carolleeae]|uniref:uncharacterized protein LOC111698600 n=1 Tax=Eurytemora carolleeae TaxID=1294199 RepID=UPI000C766B7F|nr:uncharacterized protein LOC111698600 [Eurytemora carolleeae]|eukprot:XP_023324734.1 uncharacterized protein LOC111698600 [Eurytemora affinis]